MSEKWEQSLRDLLEGAINKNRLQKLLDMSNAQLYDEMDRMTVHEFKAVLKAAINSL